MERLSWYLKRLSVMEPGEVRHRIGEQWRLRRLAAGQQDSGHSGAPVSADWREYGFCDSESPVLPELPWDVDALFSEHPDMACGRWPALGFDWLWSENPDTWHRAPDTGRTWPNDFFGAVPYRAGNPIGDARVVWEPSRLQQLVALSLLSMHSEGDDAESLAYLVAAQLRSWAEANPPYRGVHYISAMECALRLIAVCHAMDLLRGRGRETDRAWPALVNIVLGHAHLIAQRLSLYSSRGNHTIAECAGLVYAGVLFPEFGPAKAWRDRGLEILAAEAARQVLSDGGGIERAFHYHRFVMDLLGLVDRLLRHAGHEVPSAIVDALGRGVRFLAAVSDAHGETMPVGDGDGGYALSKYLRLFEQPEPGEPALHFQETGFSVTSASGSAMRLLFDHGPLGMAPSFGHAHADALSLLLYHEGYAILIDPGTFTYTGDPDWRRYFRSTAAHNTVMLDNGDQAIQETAFQWSSPPACELLRADTAGGTVRMLGRLKVQGPRSYVHLRGVAHAATGWIYIWDFLDARGDHSLAQHWHCGVSVMPSDDPDAFDLGTTAGLLRMALGGEGGSPEIVAGATTPPLGWRSSVYGQRSECRVIRRRFDGALPASLDTTITIGAATGPDDREKASLIALWRDWADEA